MTAHRRRPRSAPVRSSTARGRDRAIIARSKPACWICGSDIDYTLDWPDPMCFVVDHKMPLARGGSDTLENKAAAHNHCNSKKRARVDAPIIRRSGTLS